MNADGKGLANITSDNGWSVQKPIRYLCRHQGTKRMLSFKGHCQPEYDQDEEKRICDVVSLSSISQDFGSSL